MPARTLMDFHVDKLSSAHVYVRMNLGQTWDNLPEELLTDCAQLVKANSIEGNKKNNIVVIYTPWENLLKTGDMATGQVSFINPHMVRRIHVEKRVNDIVNRLNKTKLEKYPDLVAEKIKHEKEIRRQKRNEAEKKRKEEMRVAEERQKLKEEHGYDKIFNQAKNSKEVDDVFADDNDDDTVPNAHANDFDDFF
ncbi:hypothetical protein EV182_000601 [Spiromyces aspiralis]|uniref:Uncharacterized protein n=1 Tax=Spiromyces aspiralis TaxID=68401 RepID=A0ACC1HKK6_9FUNG|nr:hypothetical protein EV182_000601 [Spiromyces aspiralis]